MYNLITRMIHLTKVTSMEGIRIFLAQMEAKEGLEDA